MVEVLSYHHANAVGQITYRPMDIYISLTGFECQKKNQDFTVRRQKGPRRTAIVGLTPWGKVPGGPLCPITFIQKNFCAKVSIETWHFNANLRIVVLESSIWITWYCIVWLQKKFHSGFKLCKRSRFLSSGHLRPPVNDIMLLSVPMSVLALHHQGQLWTASRYSNFFSRQGQLETIWGP